REVQKYFLIAFAHMGVPAQVKTDNGPSHVSKQTQDFFALWGIEHIRGVPHCPTGQAIIECAHCT
ncbi:POK18 protein, partial [Formicarius rufipectus]|nr:POK18 protein [Formicarius rufipectus]